MQAALNKQCMFLLIIKVIGLRVKCFIHIVVTDKADKRAEKEKLQKAEQER